MKKMVLISCVAAALALGAVAASTRAQKQTGAQHDDAKHEDGGMNHADCPMMRGDKTPDGANGHDAHLDAVNKRGEAAMGFSQTATTHHFTLTRDGGVIRVEANDASDAASREQIRQHLSHIARAFAAGDFDTPMLVHDRVPPGVPAMKRLKSEIIYSYEETERGARVRIETKNADALAAIHDFLRFQITDHQTGDPLEVKER
ncbi:MAG TPA: hypothetical protein VFA21_15915 [Pyrinomonadaceae bacterium]|jgi:hypothetical protein|nr:hypothetical protein [Pyrinomonadaceae bacterium]